MLIRAVVTIVLASVLAMPEGSRSASPVRIGLTGDSIVEDGGVTSTTGLRAALRARLERDGYDAAGWGYVPAHGSTLRLEPDGTVLAPPWRYRGDWTFVGLPPFFDAASPISHRVRSRFGADGHATESTSPGARATARISGDRFAFLFVRGPDAGRFRVSVDGDGRTVDAHANTVDGGGIVWLAARRGHGKHVITITPLDGTLRFTGVLSERTGRASRPRVQVISLGHSCLCAGDRFAPAQRQAVAALELDLTLILFGTNDQVKLQAGDDDAATRAAVIAGLRTRGELARRRGGTCIIVPPAPNPRPPDIQREIRALERRAAAEAGCRYAPILARLWHPTTSIAGGLTEDGIHPTPAGYRRMARALASAIRSRPPLPAR